MNNTKKGSYCCGSQTLGAFLSIGLIDAGYRIVVADLNSDNANKALNQLIANMEG